MGCATHDYLGRWVGALGDMWVFEGWTAKAQAPQQSWGSRAETLVRGTAQGVQQPPIENFIKVGAPTRLQPCPYLGAFTLLPQLSKGHAGGQR